jgi:hypothetical protein
MGQRASEEKGEALPVMERMRRAPILRPSNASFLNPRDWLWSARPVRPPSLTLPPQTRSACRDIRAGCPGNEIGCRSSAFATPAPSWPGLSHGCQVGTSESNSEAKSCSLQPTDVLAGLVPAIHAATLRTIFKISLGGTAWMAGTSPAKTCAGLISLSRTALPQGGRESSPARPFTPALRSAPSRPYTAAALPARSLNHPRSGSSPAQPLERGRWRRRSR